MLKILPENLAVAEVYLATGSAEVTANKLDLTLAEVHEILSKNEVKRFIDNAYLDAGYRNKSKLAQVLDDMIDSKISEGGYTSEKDLLDLLKFAHQLRMDEEKKTTPTSQTNVQINNEFGGGNYGELMKRLLK